MLRLTSTASTEDDLRAVLEAWLRQDPSVRSRVLLDVAETIRHAHNGDAGANDATADRTIATDSAAASTTRHASYSRMRRMSPHVLVAGARVLRQFHRRPSADADPVGREVPPARRLTAA